MLFGSSGWDLFTRRLKAPLLIGTAEKKTRSSDCLLLQVHGAKAALDVAFQFPGFWVDPGAELKWTQQELGHLRKPWSSDATRFLSLLCFPFSGSKMEWFLYGWTCSCLLICLPQSCWGLEVVLGLLSESCRNDAWGGAGVWCEAG